jgi:hypothetical protein
MTQQLHSLIASIAASATGCAAKSATDGDLVHALLAGLRRIRSMVAAQAGYAAACAIDDAIHAQFMDRGVNGGLPVNVPLPARTLQTARAVTILTDAALSCLAVNAFFPANSAISLAVQVFSAALVERLGGVPEWGQVSAVLHGGEGDDQGDGDDGDAEWAVSAVH